MRMTLTGRLVCAAVTLALAVAATPAGATGTPTISISTPVEGAIVSRSGAATLDVAGDVVFETPVPTERRFFARATGCNGDDRLSIVRGTETEGCAWLSSTTPLNELQPDKDSTNYPAVDGVPFTLDASRPLTGVVTHGSKNVVGVGAGAGLTTIDVTVTASVRSTSGATKTTTLGTATIDYLAIPGEPYSVPWSVALPADLDKHDFLSLWLTLVVRGYNLLHGYTVPNDTYVTVPSYSASFDRHVQVAIDNGPFTSTEVTLSDDFTAWQTRLPTPSAGVHTIAARAIQSLQASPVVTRSITVTE